MRNNTLSLLSGRVKKTPSTSADSNRYTFLDLKNAEPDAGVPSAHSSLRGLFGSDTSGNRQWFYADAGLSVDTSTGQITVNENTVFIDTTLFTNSTSNNLADVLYDLDQNLQELGDNTLSTVATDDTILGAGTVGSPLSIGQSVLFTSKPEFAGLAITPDSINISGISLANPVVITTSGAHGLSDGLLVTIEDVSGTTELNGNNYYVDVLTTSTIALYSNHALTTTVDGSGFTAYVSGGKVLSGGYRFPEADGADGTYLKTNAYGLLEFDRPITYGGSQPTDPDIGDLWFDQATTGDLLIWDGSNWSSTTGGGAQGAFTLVQFQGDGTTTAFDTSNPSVNKVLVFLNGILMRLTADFTYSAGVVTFTQAPLNGDTIEVLLTGNASFVGLDLLGITNHDLITVDGSGNVTFTGNLDMGGYSITNMADPTNAQDAATKAYVDSVIGGASLSTAGDTGTGSIDLDSQTLTISGTANEIETTASAQSVIVGLPNDVTIGNNLTVTNDLIVDTNSLFVDASANTVGIGTLTPTAKLQINSNGDTTATFALDVKDSTNATLFNVRDDGKFEINQGYFFVNTSGGAYVSHGLRVRGSLTNDQGDLVVTGNVDFDSNTLYVDSANNRVGIGTATPSLQFDVWGTTATPMVIHGTNAAGPVYSQIVNTAASAVGNAAGLEFRANTSTQERQLFFIESEWTDATDATRNSLTRMYQNNAGTNELVMAFRGNDVGIGTSNPSIAKFEVHEPTGGNTLAFFRDNGYSVDLRIGSPGGGVIGVYGGSGEDLVLGTNINAENIRIQETSGNVGIGTTNPGRKLSVSGDGIKVDNGTSSAVLELYSTTDYRLQSSTNFTVYDVTNTATRFEIDTTGAITFNNAYTFPTTDGTANQTLVTDGAGNISFTTISSAINWNVADNYAFKTITDGSNSAVADTNTDTFTITGGADISAVVSAASDSLTIANTSTLDSVTGRGATTSNAITVGNLTTTGTIFGPSTFYIDPATHNDNTGTVVIRGNLTIEGTTTTVNSETLTVNDNIIVLNNNVTAAPTENAGIEVERGTSPNVQLRWNESASPEQWEITTNGTNYYKILSTADNYMADVTAGTGISISHTPGPASNATISTANIPNSSLTNSSITITDGTTPQTVDLGETITFADGTDINVVTSATNTLTVNHNVAGANSTITAATNTFVDEITVTAQGHVTSVATGTIDFNVADNFAFKNITDGVNTAVADSNVDTFTITGGTDITATVNPTADSITISFNNNSGYLTAESDTLDSVTGRGATTNNDITTGIVQTELVRGRTFIGNNINFNYASTINSGNSVQLESLAGMQLLYDTNNSDANNFMIGHGTNDPDTADIYFVIDGVGDVGIGTTTPGYSLDVIRSGAASILVGSTGGATAQLILDGNSNGDGSGNDYATISHDGTSGDLILTNLESGNIRFRSNSNAERLTILDGGNVGIGITNPSYDFHVASSGGVSASIGDTTNNNSVSFLLQRNSSNITTQEHRFVNSTNSPWYLMGQNLLWTGERVGTVNSTQVSKPYYEAYTPAVGYKEFGFVNATSGNFASTDLVANIVLANNGNVGIGITNPQRKLTVRADSPGTFTAAAFYNADTTNGNGSVFSFRTDTSGVGAQTFWEYAAVAGEVVEHDNATRSGTLRFFTVDYNGGADRLVITGDGKVGIGTDTPTELLHVKGNIVSEANGNGAGIYTFQKTIAASGSADIFTISNSHGAQVFTVMFNCSTSGMSVAKHYTVVHQFAQTPVSNLTANTGPYSGQDFTVSFTNAATNTGVKCAITNGSATIAADITVTVMLGGSPTAVTVTAL